MRQNKMRRDQRGMSMVEVIIVIAIAGILAGVSVSLIGHIRYANTMKTVESISTILSSQRVTTMSKAGTPYLYIYKLSDGYYMRQVDNCLTGFDSGVLNSDGIRISGNGATIYMDSTAGTEVDGSVFIRIAYTKGGVFETAEVGGGDTTEKTNVSKIVIAGSSTHTITLVKATGRHIVD